MLGGAEQIKLLDQIYHFFMPHFGESSYYSENIFNHPSKLTKDTLPSACESLIGHCDFFMPLPPISLKVSVFI
jgi:hypothetical protein